MRLEHHLVGGYVRYISPHIIIIIIFSVYNYFKCLRFAEKIRTLSAFNSKCVFMKIDMPLTS